MGRTARTIVGVTTRDSDRRQQHQRDQRRYETKRRPKLDGRRRAVFLFYCHYYFFPNLNESRITVASPFFPISWTDDSSGASDVESIASVAPVVSPSFPVGRNTTRPHK